MRSFLGSKVMTRANFVAVPLLAALVGIGIAIASSPASLTRDHRIGPPIEMDGSPSPTASPSASPPTVTTPGILGAKPRMEASGGTSVVGFVQNASAATADGGKTWTVLSLPYGASSVASQLTNPTH